MSRARIDRTLARLVLALLAASPGTAWTVSPAAPAATASDAASEQAELHFDRGLRLICGQGRPRDAAAAAIEFQRAAELGHVAAQSVLGWMYTSGTGVRQDDRRAAHWLRQAAEGGDAAAQNNLGVAFAIGRGVAHDHAQAERWLRAAAAQGAADAVHNLDVLLGRSPPRPQAAVMRPHPTLGAAGCRAATRRTRT